MPRNTTNSTSFIACRFAVNIPNKYLQESIFNVRSG